MATDPSPKISVVVLSYSFARYLGECIESVLAQTLRPFEIIICDDHSTDDSWTIISEYARRYPELIRSYKHEKNLGPARNWSFGFKKVRGDMITWVDGDDRWLPRKLELEWEALQRCPSAQVAYSDVYTIDAEGSRTGIWYGGNGPAPPSGDVFVEVFSRRFFPNTRSIFRSPLRYRSTLDEVGYVDDSLESYWDWDMKIRLTSRFPVVYSGEALVEYRQHSGGFSKSEPEKHFRALVQVYEKNLPLLERRSRVEVARARCHIESFIASHQMRLPSLEHLERYSIHNVYERNLSLLRQLPRHDRKNLRTELAPLLASFAHQLAREEGEKGNRGRTLKHWLEYLQYSLKDFGARRFARSVLPPWLYSGLRAVYHLVRTASQRAGDGEPGVVQEDRGRVQ